MILSKSLLRNISPQLDNSILEISGFLSTIFLKLLNLRNPVPSLLPVSPDAVGQDGHFSWQTVEASRRILRVGIIFFLADFMAFAHFEPYL